MSRKPDTHLVRLTSRRAPYRRAGVEFGSTRTPVEVPADDLTDDQLVRLSADPQISIEVIDIATGDVVAFQTEDGTVIGIAPAGGEAIGASGGETLAPSTGATSGDAAVPGAAVAGETGGGQTGAGSVPPAPVPTVEPAPPAPVTPKPAKTRQSKKPA